MNIKTYTNFNKYKSVMSIKFYKIIIKISYIYLYIWFIISADINKKKTINNPTIPSYHNQPTKHIKKQIITLITYMKTHK